MSWAVHKNIAAEKRAAKERIDRAAGRLRALFFTAAAGQESEYAAKLAEAESYLAANWAYEDAELAGAYPMLASDRAVDGLDWAAQAQAIIAQAEIWREALAAINFLRRSAKARIDAAATLRAVGAEAAAFEAQTTAASAAEDPGAFLAIWANGSGEPE